MKNSSQAWNELFNQGRDAAIEWLDKANRHDNTVERKLRFELDPNPDNAFASGFAVELANELTRRGLIS